MKHLFVFYAWVLFSSVDVQAQRSTRIISGLVVSQDEGTPLEGVRVSVKGTGNISGSQQDGMYYIEVSDKDSVLVFWHNEFQSREIELSAANNYSSNNYNVALGKEKAYKPPFSALGSWRGVFQLKAGVEVPFNFEIRTVKEHEQRIFFRNGEEAFDGGRVQVTADSVFVFLDQFDNELAFGIRDRRLIGALRKQDNSGAALPVVAEPGVSYRFPENGTAPAGNISGTYDITFTSENGKEERSVGLFRQNGDKLKGTFLHVTGDSRYLEGVVEGNNFYLSAFYGSVPVFYKGSFSPDGRLTGEVVSARGGQHFSGSVNANAALPDPYKLNWLKEGFNSFDFSFPDVDGHTVSLANPKFKNKVVIVTIGGTWCPNCVDETSFLAPWYKENHARGVEVVSIQYERKTEPDFVKKVLTRQREKYDIQYAQVFGGIADKQVVANSLPALNAFLAFPTTIIIDKKGRVAQIHTGYTGPATGEYYNAFVKEFNDKIDQLLAEK
jgi:thiol-disulfide isomerase/thioredoxin